MSTDGPRILLTGAGFTHNFGTPLADGMWAYLFSHPQIQSNPKLRGLLLDTFDFEDIYQQVVEGDYEPSEKQAIAAAIRGAYNAIDTTVREYGPGSGQTHHGVQLLISRFARPDFGDCFFTVNQDLFIERQYRFPGRQFTWPGIVTRREWTSAFWNARLENDDYSSLPTDEALQKRKESDLSGGSPVYVKLHGSQNWLDSSGQQKLVIGGPLGKHAQIQQEPLLLWYLELFRQAVAREGTRLLVIGYGFRDKHINSVLADAAETHALALHVLSPEAPKDFVARLRALPHGAEIVQALSGYYPHSLTEVLPPSGGDSPAKHLLWNGFFGEE